MLLFLLHLAHLRLQCCAKPSPLPTWCHHRETAILLQRSLCLWHHEVLKLFLFLSHQLFKPFPFSFDEGLFKLWRSGVKDPLVDANLVVE